MVQPRSLKYTCRTDAISSARYHRMTRIFHGMARHPDGSQRVSEQGPQSGDELNRRASGGGLYKALPGAGS
jgi:hypothetical protein